MNATATLYRTILNTEATDKIAPATGLRRSYFDPRTVKKDGKEEPKHARQFVDIPAVTLTVQPASLQVVMQSAFYDMQDKLIAAHIHATLGKAPLAAGRSPEVALSEEIFSVAAVIAANSGDNSKLSKAAIGAWYDAELAAVVTGRACGAMGIDLADSDAKPTAEQEQRIAGIVKQYRDTLQDFAATVASYDREKAIKLLALVRLATDTTSATAVRLVAKIEPHTKEKADNSALADLGL